MPPTRTPSGKSISLISFPDIEEEDKTCASIISASPSPIEYTLRTLPCLMCLRIDDTVVALGLTNAVIQSGSINLAISGSLIKLIVIGQPKALACVDTNKLVLSSSVTDNIASVD